MILSNLYIMCNIKNFYSLDVDFEQPTLDYNCKIHLRVVTHTWLASHAPTVGLTDFARFCLCCHLGHPWFTYTHILLLFRIDHWDNEKEKVIILTDTSLITIKYNFILKKVIEFKRLMLVIIDTVAIGDFQYPPTECYAVSFIVLGTWRKLHCIVPCVKQSLLKKIFF